MSCFGSCIPSNELNKRKHCNKSLTIACLLREMLRVKRWLFPFTLFLFILLFFYRWFRPRTTVITITIASTPTDDTCL